MPQGLPFIFGFFSPSFARPPPPAPAVFSSSAFVLCRSKQGGLKGRGRGAYKLKGIGPYSVGLVHGLFAFVPGHSSADFFTPVKAL